MGVIPNGQRNQDQRDIRSLRIINLPSSCFRLHIMIKKKADRAVTFIENLCHTKGKWAGTPFRLLPWQEQLIRDIFGIVKPDGEQAVPHCICGDM